MFVALLFCVQGTTSAEDSVANRLQAIASGAYGGNGPGASIMVYRDGVVLLHEAFGMANIEMQVPMSTDNRFRIASVTKQFGGAVVMSLVEDGILDLDADIRTYLPDFADKGGVITLRHLLHHTSGLYNYTNNDAYEAIEFKDISLADTLQYYENEPLDFPVGTNWSYSNSGYALMSLIVEQVTGKPFAEVVAERIFTPAGMTHSEFQRRAAVMDMSPNQYWRGENGFYQARRHGISGRADGGIFSTTGDLLKWHKALWGGNLLGKAALEALLTSATLPDGRDTRYGFGLFYGRIGPHRTFEHGGNVGGWRAYVIMLPDVDTFVAILANSTHQNEQLVAANLAKAALGVNPEGPPPVAVDRAELVAFAGTYHHGPNDVRVIRVKDDQLQSSRGGRQWYDLVAIGEGRFMFSGDPDTVIVFEDDGLRVTYRYGMDHLAKR